MITLSQAIRNGASGWGFAGLCLALCAGCGRNDIRVYQVPKEGRQSAQATGAHGGHDHSGGVQRPTWKAPEAWRETEAGSVRLARFAIGGPDGQEAEVAVMPLPGQASRRDLVNIWREQIQLKPASEEEVRASAETVAVGSESGELFEMVSDGPLINDQFKLRVLVAMLNQGSSLWVFKLGGADPLVQNEKPRFLEFLKSIEFTAGSTGAPTLPEGHPPLAGSPATAPGSGTAGAMASSGSSQKPAWEVPPSWQEVPATQMLLAKFVAKGEAEATADITVSFFPGETGGLLANINRWRGQIELDMVDETEMKELTKPLDLPGGNAILVDMTGTDAKTRGKSRLIGAVVPRGGQTWFFKLIGDERVAEREKAAFVKFIQSVKFPDA